MWVLLSLVGVATLAVLVNFIELLCTAGFPARYTAILTQQELDPVTYYAYLGLYILGYMAGDSVMLTTAVLALSSNRLTAQSGRVLKGVSGLVMLGLGLVLVIRPGTQFLINNTAGVMYSSNKHKTACKNGYFGRGGASSLKTYFPRFELAGLLLGRLPYFIFPRGGM